MNVLTFTRLWPNSVEPGLAIFNEHRARAVAMLPGYSIRAVAPVPWFPGLPAPERYARYARVPLHEERFGIPAEHPRYPVVPKIGLRLQGPALAAAASKTVAEVVRRGAVDVIDAHYVYPDGWAAVEIGRRLGLPVVVTACGSDVWATPHLHGIRPFVEETLSGATRLVAVSQPLAQGLRSFGADPAKLRVIPYGIDASRFSFDPAGREIIRTRLGLRADDSLVLAVGRLEKVKGHDLLIEAAAKMQRQVRFVIVGEGRWRAELESRIRVRRLDGTLTLAGAVPNEQLGAWYSAADLFCLPSRAEGHPNVLIEALATGTPSIAAAVGAIPAILTPGAGLLIPPEDVGALTCAIQAGLCAVRDGLWTRETIRQAVAGRSWRDVALETAEVFDAATRRQPQQRSA